ncbi:GNAT family N-acetyltransferase [Floricoccus penangensis]|nr:GNAT family N-acetyltransferase [Floricoccus penangensis]
MGKIILKKPQIIYINQLQELMLEFASNKDELHGGSRVTSYANLVDWIIDVDKFEKKENICDERVPAIQYLAIREKDDKLIGLVSIRLELNDHLLNFGGHIGFSIIPSERKSGYGKELLRLAIKEAKKLDITNILVTCYEHNIAAKLIIEANGGIFEDARFYHIKNLNILRYWIDADPVLLVKPSMDYARQILDYKVEYSDSHSSYIFGSSELTKFESISEWLEYLYPSELIDEKDDSDENSIPHVQYLAVRKSDDKLIGLVNLRLDLNDFLEKYIGNVGYSVRPSERRKGYASKILKLIFEEAYLYDLKKLLLVCNEDNIASIKTIEKNGGILEDIVINYDNKLQKRYWVNLKELV